MPVNTGGAAAHSPHLTSVLNDPDIYVLCLRFSTRHWHVLEQ